jgi:hypothetical protein
LEDAGLKRTSGRRDPVSGLIYRLRYGISDVRRDGKTRPYTAIATRSICRRIGNKNENEIKRIDPAPFWGGPDALATGILRGALRLLLPFAIVFRIV